MKKNISKLMALLVGAIGLFAMTGCGKAAEPVTVTFMNGDEVLGTVEVGAGEVLDEEDYAGFEAVEGCEFEGWYETPSYLEASLVDLSTATFEEDTTLYGLFSGGEVTEDTNTWYIAGSSSKGSLATNNWAADLPDDTKAEFALEKAEDGNVFTITIDLYAGDQFQLIPNWGWDGQLGWGYVTECDASQMENGGGLSGSDSTSNINVLLDGNYTITLTTNPDDTAQNSIVIVRNGDAAAADAVEEEPFEVTETTCVKVKGSWVEDWSELKDLDKVSDGVFSITMDLDAGTELYFSIYDGDTDTGLGLKGENVTDEASLALIDATNNVKVNAAGTYTFTVDLNANTVTVTQ